MELPVFVRHPDALPVRHYRIPIVYAGAGLPAWDDSGEFVVLGLPELENKPESQLFAVRVVGDSMSPTYLEGEIVVCWTEGEARPGKVVAVHVHGDGLVLKRLQLVGGQPMLYSDNPAYPPEPLGEYDRIYGVAVGSWRPAGR
ncbi:MAG: S24 family peptidase [Meiothermus sp.]|uniref:S24 family peptidase n=1 Tax=Meiothermus sp. TaxID=1955249 RepID=UPI00298EE9F5|nr:S24 family peptidase [Meiothermus sp.]MDW8482676.1 S24 family peptidase [Meiothermus sp.]